MDNNIIDKLASIFHSIWKDEKEDEGYHLPDLCPNFEDIEDEEGIHINKDLIHCNKCLSNLVEYESLSEYQKEIYKTKAEKLYKNLKIKGLEIIHTE